MPKDSKTSVGLQIGSENSLYDVKGMSVARDFQFKGVTGKGPLTSNFYATTQNLFCIQLFSTLASLCMKWPLGKILQTKSVETYTYNTWGKCIFLFKRIKHHSCRLLPSRETHGCLYPCSCSAGELLPVPAENIFLNFRSL